MKDENKSLSYKWHSAYYISRALDRIKINSQNEDQNKIKAKAFIKEIRDAILHHKQFGASYLDLLALAARWAEYLLKMNLNDNDYGIS